MTRPKVSWLRALSTTLGAVVFTLVAQAAPYQIVDIGAPDGSNSQVVAVSRSGQVVGVGGNGAFSWAKSTGMIELSALQPTAMNNVGQVVGLSSPTDTSGCGDWFCADAILWTPGSGMTRIGRVGGVYAYPLAVNDAGQVVGYTAVPNSSGGLSFRGFLWTQVGGAADLASLGGDQQTIAFAINNSGQVVGQSNIAGDVGFHAFIWTASGGIRDLGTLGGVSSAAMAISDTGQVIGTSQVADGSWHAFSWTQADGMIDIGTLGGSSIGAYAVNRSGQVTGAGSLPTDVANHAFVWSPTQGLRDIQSLGGSTFGRTAANEAGQVVGTIQYNGYRVHAFSWTQSGGMIDLGTLGGESHTSIAVGVSDEGLIAGHVSLNDYGAGMRAAIWVPAADTMSGSNVSVSLGRSVSLVFAAITQPGVTTLTPSPSAPGTQPAFSVNGTNFELSTTATFAGAVHVTYSYDPTALSDPSLLRLFHYSSASDTWVDITTSVNLQAHTVTGVTESFSWFAVGVPRRRFSGLLAPVNDDGSSTFKLGSTVPIKFMLQDRGGTPVNDIPAQLYLTKVSNGITGSEQEAVSTAAADTGNTFRVSGQQYVFNLSTKNLSQGTWQIRIAVADGMSYVRRFSLTSK